MKEVRLWDFGTGIIRDTNQTTRAAWGSFLTDPYTVWTVLRVIKRLI